MRHLRLFIKRLSEVWLDLVPEKVHCIYSISDDVSVRCECYGKMQQNILGWGEKNLTYLFMKNSLIVHLGLLGDKWWKSLLLFSSNM